MISPPFSIDFPCAYETLPLSAQFRERPDDFYVEERLGFALSGEGEHVCLFVEKQSHNTHWVKAALAEYAGISERDIGVCGRKDRHAITRQWFSIYDPSRQDIDWSAFSMEGTKIIDHTRHHKKLRLGDHRENHFVIRLRNIINRDTRESLSDQEKTEYLQEVIDRLTAGVPNYFGSQRFGREGNNLLAANNWLAKNHAPSRQQRSIVLSAARSYLFNQVLAHRVREGTWQTLINGDVSFSTFEGVDVPTGPLWGRGRLSTQTEALHVESSVLQDFAVWCDRLEHLGLNQERRALVLIPTALSCFWQQEDLILSFNLPSGAFATALLAEVAELQPKKANTY